MNEFENQFIDKTLAAIHHLEVKFVQELGELRGDIKTLNQRMDTEYKNLQDALEKNIDTDTQRLNKHSNEIDNCVERLATVEEWKKQFETSVKNRIGIGQSISTVVAVVIAYVLGKFF